MRKWPLLIIAVALVSAGCQRKYESVADYRTWRGDQVGARERGDGPADLGDGKSWYMWRTDSGQCLLDNLVSGGGDTVIIRQTLLFPTDPALDAFIKTKVEASKPTQNPIETYRANRALELGATQGHVVMPTEGGHVYGWSLPDGTLIVDSLKADGKGGITFDPAQSKPAPTLSAAQELAGGPMKPNLTEYIETRASELDGASLDWAMNNRFWLLLGFKTADGTYTLDFMKADTSRGAERLKTQSFPNLNALALFVDSNAQRKDVLWASNLQYSKLGFALIGTVLLVLFSVIFNIRRARSSEGLTIRRINGLDQIDEAVGRATETARPVLMVPGLSAQLDGIAVQALTVFAYVVRSAARFRTPIRLLNYNAAVYAVAQEIVRDVYVSEGVPEQFDPDSVRFVTDRQFAFAAAVAGLIQREKVAAAFMMGDFFAESLIFAENANLVGAIQVAATTQFTQTPFFIAACDYVLLGDEFYAASAYLGRQPVLLGSMIGIDWAKMMFMLFVVIASLTHSYQMSQKVDVESLPAEQREMFERLNQQYMDPTKDELFFKRMTKMRRF